MKRIFFLAASTLLLPALAFAAFDDVTLTTDAVITVGGINLTVSGSSAVVESITVNANDFSFVLLSGSSLQVSSADRRVLSTNSPTQFITNNECNSSASVLKHSSTANGSFTIAITPQSSTCGSNATSATVPSSSSSVSSSLGGGITPASLINPTPPSTVAQNIGIPVTPTVTVPAPAALQVPTAPTNGASAVFTRAFSVGASHADVKRLQQLLNTDPDTRIAESGAGSPGKESAYFGSLTTKAIQKFQVKYNVAKPGDTGYGGLGPKTRAKLQEVFGTPSTLPTPPSTSGTEQVQTTSAGTVSPVFNRILSPGASHADVKRLQQLLNTDPDTRIAESGAGSPGKESAYFGSLTTKAIQKFQVKYNVAKPGEVGYGLLGPKTRAKLQEVFGH